MPVTPITIVSDKKVNEACSRGDPEKTYAMLQQSFVYDRNSTEPVFVHARRDTWVVLRSNDEMRRKMIEAIVNTDACLADKPRSIYVLDPDSNMIGKATPEGGIEIM
ncbi:hypothetical protein [Dokdonella immobilis]|uniref:Uncharacterized protein n=1 Tax=Dokdonella immobilis TaxID=578942 RepID=A0A1I4W0Q7_9GAMM|nr:hypothetical protein [Dokdonella immobilis]SFN06897.1 hypothetical protein SAMN05216289_103227 [Dokdonella immobilis]